MCAAKRDVRFTPNSDIGCVARCGQQHKTLMQLGQRQDQAKGHGSHNQTEQHRTHLRTSAAPFSLFFRGTISRT
jgi:hypothetical protein